MQNKNSDYL